MPNSMLEAARAASDRCCGAAGSRTAWSTRASTPRTARGRSAAPSSGCSRTRSRSACSGAHLAALPACLRVDLWLWFLMVQRVASRTNLAVSVASRLRTAMHGNGFVRGTCTSLQAVAELVLTGGVTVQWRHQRGRQRHHGRRQRRQRDRAQRRQDAHDDDRLGERGHPLGCLN
jgi:hypothetical protein